MPYESFACPECGNEVDSHENVFCQECGVNLSQFSRLQRKTFYYSYERCYKCGKPTYKVESQEAYVHVGEVTKKTSIRTETCSSCHLNKTNPPFVEFRKQRTRPGPSLGNEEFAERVTESSCPHCGSNKELCHSGRPIILNSGYSGFGGTTYQQKIVCFSCGRSFEHKYYVKPSDEDVSFR